MGLEWNVWVGNWNRKTVEPHNIFDHGGFLEDCRKIYNKYGKGRNPDKGSFLEEIRQSLMYYYWSKSEWEIVLQHWPPYSDGDGEKIDVYQQVRMNWDQFCEYLWDHRSSLNYF